MRTTQPPPTVDEPEIGYGQILGILLRRFIWFGGAIVGGLGLAVLLTLREDPTYQSSMQLLVEPNYRQTVDITGDQNTDDPSQTDYATQLNLMRSTTFVEQTVEKLLSENPEFCSDPETRESCTNGLKRGLTLSQLSEGGTKTRIFEASYRAEDPTIVQAFLETLGEVYLSYNEAQQDQRLEDGLALVNQQIEEVEENLALSRQDLRQFRENESLIDPEQQALAIASNLQQIEQTQLDVESQYLDTRAEYEALQTQLQANPESALIASRLSQSSRYQQLLNSLQEAELALQQRLALYTEAEPGVQDLIVLRRGRILLLQEEVIRVLGGVPAQFDLDESTLLTEGQLGAIDLQLVADLVEAEVRLERLEARRSGLERAAQDLQTEFNAFPGLIAEYDRIQPEGQIQQQSLEQLLQLRQEITNELAQGGFSWDVVEAPRLGRKISPQPRQNLLLGVVAGAFVGGALAFGREAIDTVVRTSDDLKKQATLPLLGVVPEIPMGKEGVLLTILDAGQAPADSFSLSQWQPFRDAVDLIYKTIQLTTTQSVSSLMITSALPEEGKTTLSLGLAMSAARSHQRVLLIDANLRHPSLHECLGLSNVQGLSTQLLTPAARLDPLKISPISVPLAGTSIDVLLAGEVPDDPVRLLSSLQMRRLLEKAEAKYDLVIVDAPVISGLADGLQLASLCKASIMVSRLEHITQSDLTHAMSILRQVNTIGVVANRHREANRSDKLYDRNGTLSIPEEEPKLIRRSF